MKKNRPSSHSLVQLNAVGFHDDWTHVQLSAMDYPTPEERGEVMAQQTSYWGQYIDPNKDIFDEQDEELVQIGAGVRFYPSPAERGESLPQYTGS